MRRTLSSPFTFFEKFVLSGILVLLVVVPMLYGTIIVFHENGPFWLLLVQAFIVLMVVLHMAHLKKVWIQGQYLHISNYRKEIKIHRSNVAGIQEGHLPWHSIGISFKVSTDFGWSITFVPTPGIIPFFSHPAYQELKEFVKK